MSRISPAIASNGKSLFGIPEQIGVNCLEFHSRGEIANERACDDVSCPRVGDSGDQGRQVVLIEKVCLLNIDHAGRPNGDSQIIRLLFRLDLH